MRQDIFRSAIHLAHIYYIRSCRALPVRYPMSLVVLESRMTMDKEDEDVAAFVHFYVHFLI